jgi:hypothetical protein
VSVVIFASDSDGNDLIKEDMPGMSVTFRGDVYEVVSRVQTKSLYVPFDGLMFRSGNDGSHNRLVFGPFSGEEDMDEDMVLTWPDGSTNTIHYHCSDHREWPSVKCKRSWKLDGKSHKGNEFHFVK